MLNTISETIRIILFTILVIGLAYSVGVGIIRTAMWLWGRVDQHDRDRDHDRQSGDDHDAH